MRDQKDSSRKNSVKQQAPPESTDVQSVTQFVHQDIFT